VYSKNEDRSAILASCHTRSLARARELGARTIAFPAISTGVYGYPVERAAPVAIGAARDFSEEFDEIRFVLFDDATHGVFARALEAAERSAG
jgi:O-acetyl-ADP-ribose deacetylase (regulator of RNase III)